MYNIFIYCYKPLKRQRWSSSTLWRWRTVAERGVRTSEPVQGEDLLLTGSELCSIFDCFDRSEDSVIAGSDSFRRPRISVGWAGSADPRTIWDPVVRGVHADNPYNRSNDGRGKTPEKMNNNFHGLLLWQIILFRPPPPLTLFLERGEANGQRSECMPRSMVYSFTQVSWFLYYTDKWSPQVNM